MSSQVKFQQYHSSGYATNSHKTQPIHLCCLWAIVRNQTWMSCKNGSSGACILSGSSMECLYDDLIKGQNMWDTRDGVFSSVLAPSVSWHVCMMIGSSQCRCHISSTLLPFMSLWCSNAPFRHVLTPSYDNHTHLWFCATDRARSFRCTRHPSALSMLIGSATYDLAVFFTLISIWVDCTNTSLSP